CRARRRLTGPESHQSIQIPSTDHHPQRDTTDITITEGEHMRFTWRHLIALLAVLGLVLAACGDDDGDGDDGAGQTTSSAPDTTADDGDDGSDEGDEGDEVETVTLKVGILPIADMAPLYLGMDLG